MSRLEEIKRKRNDEIDYKDKVWLINRVEELKDDNGRLKSDVGVLEIAISHVHLPKINRYKQALERIDNAFNDVQLDDEMFNSEVEDILISIKKGESE